MSNSKQAIRDIEDQVLDHHHKTFGLLSRPEDVAIEHILKMYGEGLRHYERTKGSGREFRGQRYIVESLSHGLAHCFRWLAAQPERTILLPDMSDATLDREAHELLLWSANYEGLAADHIAWGRGHVTAGIDESTKTITFSHPSEADAASFARQIEAQQTLSDLNERGVPYAALQTDFQAWADSPRVTLAGIEFPWNPNARARAVQALHQWLMRAIWPEVPEGTDLGGFTLAEFRQLFAFLYTMCLYRTWLEDLADHALPGSVPSQPLARTVVGFAQWLSEMSGVSEVAAASIVALLTLDSANIHSKVSNQPFIPARSGEIFLLPRLLTRIDLSRMLAGALNKRGGKDIYDRISQLFERSTLDQIEARFAQESHIEVAREKHLRGDGDTFTPDFVIFEPSRNQLLVIDYKHALVPYSTADVDSKIKEYASWRDKMRRYCDFVTENLTALTPYLPSLSASVAPVVSGMILTRWPLPIPLSLDSDMCVSDWASLRRHLADGQSLHIEELQQWAKTRPDINAPTQFRYAPRDTTVGEWTYRRMMIWSDEQAAEAS